MNAEQLEAEAAKIARDQMAFLQSTGIIITGEAELLTLQVMQCVFLRGANYGIEQARQLVASL